MVQFYELADLSFPRFSEDILSNTEARQAIAKASAYYTFALEEAGINHDREMNAAMVTDATYNLQEDCSAEEYLELAIQEIAYAEGQLDETNQTREDLRLFREAVERRQ